MRGCSNVSVSLIVALWVKGRSHRCLVSTLKRIPESCSWTEANCYLSACHYTLREGASNHSLNKKKTLISHTRTKKKNTYRWIPFYIFFFLSFFFLWPCLVLPWVMIILGLYCIHHSGLNFYSCQCRNAACALHCTLGEINIIKAAIFIHLIQ